MRALLTEIYFLYNKTLADFVSVNMKCYWTVNNSYLPPLLVGQYELYCSHNSIQLLTSVEVDMKCY